MNKLLLAIGLSRSVIVKKLSILISLCCLAEQAAVGQTTSGTVYQPQFNSDPNVIRAIVRREAAKLGSKAVEFGMWVNENEIVTMALGDSMTTVPARTNMHYRIGGIALTFMSTLLLILVKDQRVSLDTPIAPWFPGLLDADKVTPRMLVANTAGYIDYVSVQDFQDLQMAQPFRTFTDDELIQYSVRDGKMNFPPGTSQKYSHTDNAILGQFIQRATGESIKDLYDEYLFGPLGMKDTRFPPNQNIQNPVLHAFTGERGVYEDNTYWNPSWASTPGLPTSNLRDLGKWGPVFGSGRLLTPELFKLQTAFVALGENKPDLYFAFGFVVANGWYAQNPAINGYSGGFAYKPSIGVTITAEATKSETASSEGAGFEIVREVTKYVTPKSPINFGGGDKGKRE